MTTGADRVSVSGASVTSECGVLRQVLVAAADHDGDTIGIRALTVPLRDRGIEVLTFDGALTVALARPSVRAFVIDRVIAAAFEGPPADLASLRAHLADLPPDALADTVLRGVPEFLVDASARRTQGDRSPSVPPLGAARTPRDLAIVCGPVVLFALSSNADRARGTVALRAVLGARHDTASRLTPYSRREAGDRGAVALDGGDVHIHGRQVLVGVGRRSTAAGATLLARTLFAAGAVDRVTMVRLPDRPYLHGLDELITQVDDGIAVTGSAVQVDQIATRSLVRDGVRIAAGSEPAWVERSFGEVLRRGDHPIAARLIRPEGAGAHPPASVVVLAPGVVVVGGSHAGPIRSALAAEGIDAVPVAGATGTLRGLRAVLIPLDRDAV